MGENTKSNKVLNAVAFIILTICFLGGIVYAAAPNIMISHFQISNMQYESGQTEIGIYAEIPNESNNSTDVASVSMAVYDDTGKKYEEFSQKFDWNESDKTVLNRYISLKWDTDKNLDYRVEVDSSTNGSKQTIVKNFDVGLVYKIGKNIDFKSTPVLENGKIKLSWTPVDNATSYEVYFSPYDYYENVTSCYRVYNTSAEVDAGRFVETNDCSIFIIALQDCKRIGRSESYPLRGLPTSLPLLKSQDSRYKISGTINYESDESIKGFQSDGFYISVDKTSINTYSQTGRYFELPFLFRNKSGYTLKISNVWHKNFLARYIKVPATDSDLDIGTINLTVWPGDLNSDDAINLIDIMMVAKSFNSREGDSKYSRDSDINRDNAVNLTDIMIVAKHFNCTSSDYPEIKIG